MKVARPAYKQNGHKWFEDVELSKHDIEYHIDMLPIFNDHGYLQFPEFVREDMINYSETVHALLLAGF